MQRRWAAFTLSGCSSIVNGSSSACYSSIRKLVREPCATSHNVDLKYSAAGDANFEPAEQTSGTTRQARLWWNNDAEPTPTLPPAWRKKWKHDKHGDDSAGDDNALPSNSPSPSTVFVGAAWSMSYNDAVEDDATAVSTSFSYSSKHKSRRR